MIFERPEFLALAPLAALLFAFAVGAHWRRVRKLATAYELTALRRLLPAHADRFPTGRLLYLVGAGVLIGLAVAGPVWFDPEPPEAPPPLDMAIAVDLSLSMTAADAFPSRIGRAREAIARLTEELPSVRFSLVVFSGWPFMLVPPTDDPAIVRYFVESLQPEVVQERDRGNSLTATLELARSTLESRPSPDARQAILVISDGDVYEDQDEVARAASTVSAAGFEVWAAGLGSEDGATLTLDGAPVRDVTGRAVRTGQDAELLRLLADAGRGRYEDISGDGGLESLVADLRDLSGDSEEGPAEPFDTRYLFALLAIPLLLWEGIVDAGRSGRVRGAPRNESPTHPERGQAAVERAA